MVYAKAYRYQPHMGGVVEYVVTETVDRVVVSDCQDVKVVDFFDYTVDEFFEDGNMPYCRTPKEAIEDYIWKQQLLIKLAEEKIKFANRELNKIETGG